MTRLHLSQYRATRKGSKRGWYEPSGTTSGVPRICRGRAAHQSTLVAKKGKPELLEVKTGSMDRTNIIGVDGSEPSDTFGSEDASKGNARIRDSIAEALTTEKVFQMVTSQLGEMGYHCSSVEKSEDFTERIDGVLTKQIGSGDPEMSGYSRILTVYRSGGKIHVELYNFLKTFPSDNEEMSEVRRALNNLFQKNDSVKMDIHE